MPNLTLYGIPNCDTVKKARNYLEARGISYHFHDYKKAGVTAADLERWSEVVGWEKLLNKAGTTFKKLPDADKAGIAAASCWVASLMVCISRSYTSRQMSATRRSFSF